MFTAVMCLALVGIVALSGVIYSQTMAELFSRQTQPGAEAPGSGRPGPLLAAPAA